MPDEDWYAGTVSSEREKKKIVSAGLRKLKAKPGWDPAAPVDPADRLTQLQSDLRAEKAMDAAENCEACAAAEDGLCEDHLASALGF